MRRAPAASRPSVNVNHSALALIQHGEIVSCELAPSGSNYTFLVRVRLGDRTGLAIYKPRDGEAPLWDFPAGTLYKRECAAYLLDQALGWNFIPPTVVRDGPYGIGAVQEYVEHDPRQNYYTLTEANATGLQMIVCFDLVANNTDRKAAHVLVDTGGKLWGIDHGLTFHAATKIRTVIWDFCGEPIPESLLASLAGLCRKLANPQGPLKELLGLLHQEEIRALEQRLDWVLTKRAYPGLPSQHRQRS